MDQFKQLLHEKGVRLTQPRMVIFDVLNHADKPVAIQDIVKRSAGADRSSVYRTLELFETLGIIATMYTGWKKRYELSGAFKPHHHHLQCTRCGELVELDTPVIEKISRDIAKKQQYILTGHHFELSGVCPHCQKFGDLV